MHELYRGEKISNLFVGILGMCYPDQLSFSSLRQQLVYHCTDIIDGSPLFKPLAWRRALLLHVNLSFEVKTCLSFLLPSCSYFSFHLWWQQLLSWGRAFLAALLSLPAAVSHPMGRADFVLAASFVLPAWTLLLAGIVFVSGCLLVAAK